MYNSLERTRDKLIKEYRVVQVHVIDDEVYMYKLLSKLEYETITSQIEDELDLQDAIVQNCVLYPEDLEIDDMLPGNVFELAQEIVQQSCVLPEDRLLMLEVFGAEMTQLDNVMICLIMRACFGNFYMEIHFVPIKTSNMFIFPRRILQRTKTAEFFNLN